MLNVEDDLSILNDLIGEGTAAVPLSNSQSEPVVRSQPADASSMDLFVEPYSRIRIDPSKRRLSRQDLDTLAATFRIYRMYEVQQLLHQRSPAPSSWLALGVLVDKQKSKKTQRGDSFCVWKLSDLKPGGAASTISLFLFGDAAMNSWKELPGSLFAIVAPRVNPPREGSESNEMTLSVDKETQLQRVGQVCLACMHESDTSLGL